MNPDFQKVIDAKETDRRDLFLTAANRLGTPIQNVEKDFWVCWTLDALFNGLPEGPRLLFKGGTSLSKGFGLISRFSEDIDITVFREDIGQPTSIEELEALSGKKRSARLDAIRTACQAYIGGPLATNLSGVASQALLTAGISKERGRIELDKSDETGQSLLFWYPTVVENSLDYVRAAVKIESGAKPALDPHQAVTITPYVATDLPGLDLQVRRVTTVNPERTFWDKIVILHGQRSWFEKRGDLRHGGQRVSRHYYDVFKLMESEAAKRALADPGLGIDCSRHARLFFFSADYDLEHAVPGTLRICPTDEMKTALQRDYEAMSGMIFGQVPRFEDVLAVLGNVDRLINGRTV
jgi:hypothetical protein